MILIINTCKEELHYIEFVKPIEDTLKCEKQLFQTVKLKELTRHHIDCSDKIIMCGTSLKDFDYQNYMDKCLAIEHTTKPILGICAGMQIICEVFGCTIIDGTHIGINHATFDNFLGIHGDKEIYELHQKIIEENEQFKKIFEVKARSQEQKNQETQSVVQAIKHKEKNIYATLFHPEVRNIEIIKKFAKMNFPIDHSEQKITHQSSTRRTSAS